MTDDDRAELDARHAEKMRKKKAARDKIIAGKTIEKGLLIVHTGKGKGKSTAAFGMVFRGIGHGMRVGVVQFVKGAWSTGERDRAREIRRPRHHQGDGRGLHLGNAGPRSATSRTPAPPGSKPRRMIARPGTGMVLLDELNIVLRYDYLPLEEVLAVLQTTSRATSTSSSPAATPATSSSSLPTSSPRWTDDQAPVPLGREGTGWGGVLIFNRR